MTTLVVAGDGDVDEVGGGVGVAESNDGDVDVAGLLDSLGVGAGVGDNDQARLLERAGDVVSEATGGETTGDGGGSGVSGELQDSALAVGTGRDNTDVGRVVDCRDDAGSKDDFLPIELVSLNPAQMCSLSSLYISIPSLANVDNVDAIRASLPEVRLHVNLDVL